jgi:hypothetical protein
VGNVGLLFVGAVLFLNGVMLLGWVEAKSAAPINFFVGVLQVVTPTYLVFTANGDADVILAATGLYLFGFTYLYVGVNLAFDLDGTGLGYFCAFVVVFALVYSGLNFIRFQDHGFGVIWLYWAFLWAVLPGARSQTGWPHEVHRSGVRHPGLGDRNDPRLPAPHRGTTARTSADSGLPCSVVSLGAHQLIT